MKNQKLRVKKLAKKRAHRKDFVRRDNINKNVPTKIVTERVEKYQSVETKGVVVDRVYRNGKFTEIKKNVQQFNANGTPKIVHVGYKEVTNKVKQFRNHVKGDRSKPLYDAQDREIGMIAYPLSRKYRSSRKVLQTT